MNTIFFQLFASTFCSYAIAASLKIIEFIEIPRTPSGMRSNRTAFSLRTLRVLWCCYAHQKNLHLWRAFLVVVDSKGLFAWALVT